MARHALDLQVFGINMDKEAFVDLMCDAFNGYVRGTLTVDELLLRPRMALHFCDTVRAEHQFHDLPDDVILRVIMGRRKRPGEATRPT
jgi:hypothetical protein